MTRLDIFERELNLAEQFDSAVGKHHVFRESRWILNEVKRMRAALAPFADANSADPDRRAAWEAFCGVDPESKASEGPERRK